MKFKIEVQKKHRGKKGEGRKVMFTQINLPSEIAEDLKLYKLIYSQKMSGENVSYESIMRHWMNIVNEREPEIKSAFDAVKSSRKKFAEEMAADLGLTPEQLQANEAAHDPADEKNEPWKMRYVFEKNGKEIEAIPGDKEPFYARMAGRNVGMKEMLADGWTLLNEIGDELNFQQAERINALFKKC